MKAIGHTDGGTTTRQWSNTPLTNPLSPHTLYIPEPGTRENIDADQFQHVGWVNPDQGNGKIFSTHANAAEYGDARPAYIRRLPQIGSRNHEVADAQTPTRGPLFHMPTGHLIETALTFCNERLDEHRGSISSENAYADCNRANTIIRELVRRLQTAAEPRCPKCGAQVDERWDCCETHERTQEPPMTFYDHAFIHAAINHRHYYGDEGITVTLLEDAHRVAGQLTRNRANKP